MKLPFIILCFATVFFDVKCGLIKNLLGTVSDKVHEVTDGNIVKNVGNMMYNETKGIVEDLGDLLHLRKNKNNEKKEETDGNKDVQHGEVSNSATSATNQVSTTETTDKSIQPNEPNVNDITTSTRPETEITEGKIKEGESSKEESTELYTDSSKSSSIEENHHYGEGKISPRTARHVQTNYTEDGLVAQTETSNIDTFDEVIVMYENSKLTNFNNLSDDKITDIPNDNNGVEVVIVDDCPKGEEMMIDGSCIDTDGSTEKSYHKGVGRANFVAGCFNGFAPADDGSCQEILYD